MVDIHGVLYDRQSLEQLGVRLQDLCSTTHHPSVRWPRVLYGRWIPL